jgi:hypothetical protein
MASAEDYAAWIVKNQDKKGTPEFDTVSRAYQAAKGVKAPDVPSAADNYDPSEGGGTLQFGPIDTGVATPQWLDRGLAGVGKAFVDVGRRAKQIATLNGNQADIDEAEKLDAPLMRTGMGVAGNIVGNLALSAGPAAAVSAIGKAAAIPKLVQAGRAMFAPTTIPGAAVQGAAMGALQPVPSEGSTVRNLMYGAMGGAAVPATVATGRLGKDLAMPFFKSGQEDLAARTLQRFSADPNAIANANLTELVPGSAPTLAEATQDTGLSQLQRTLRNNPDANIPITARLQQNQAARVQALDDIAGDPAKREFFEASRDTDAKDLYDKAFAESPTMTPWIKGQITALQKRPAFNAAYDRAATLAADQGITLNPENSVQVLHFTKMALDSQAAAAARAGDDVALKGIMDTKQKLVSLIESPNVSPPYREARETFSAMSKPINQMDLGTALRNKLVPALADMGAETRSTPGAFAQALRNGDQTARTATGFRGASLGMGGNSATMQNLASQDILRGVLGPLGLPQKWAEAALPNQLLKAGKVAYSGVDDRVLGLLGQAVADPKEAQRMLATEIAKRAKRARLDQAIPYTVTPGTAGLLGLESAQ